MRPYEEEYERFWKDIVEDRNGILNLDQVKRELSDYSQFGESAATVYDRLTNGAISKINTHPAVIVSEVESLHEDYTKEAVRAVLSELIDHTDEEGASVESITWLINHLYNQYT